MKKYIFDIRSNNTSDDYYFDTLNLSKKIRKSIKLDFELELEDFIEFHKISSYESQRYEEEYVVDILLLGILWREFIDKALNISDTSYKILDRYNSEKYRNKKFKSKIREKFIKKKIYADYFCRNKNEKNREYNYKNFNILMKYLINIEDYKLYYDRLIMWRDFLSNIRGEYCEKFLEKLAVFCEKYFTESEKILDKYILDYNSYLSNIKLSRYKDLDLFNYYIPKSLIYLNMIANQILNDLNSNKIKNIDEKFCIISKNYLSKDKLCEGPATDRGRLCNECSFDCRMNKITRVFKLYSYELYVSDNDMIRFDSLNLDEKVGIIAMSNISNMLDKYYYYRKSDAIIIVIPYDIYDVSSNELEINMNYIINNIIN